MPQIIQETTPGGRIGEQLGQGLQTGLSSGLQSLAALRLNDLQKRQMGSGLQALGLSPQLAYLDPRIQQEIVKRQLLGPSEQAYASALSELLGGQPQQVGGLQALQQGLAPQTQGIEALQGLESQQLQPLTTQQPQQIQPVAPKLTAGQATKLAELGLKKQEMAKAEKAAAFKETKKLREEIIDKSKVARQSLHDLERMEELEKEGKLDTPGYLELLKRSGFDIPALMNPGSEEFNKVAASFIRDAKANFGARISNFELEQFLKTIPSLSQSPEGRKRVIANLKYVSRANLEYNKALKEILAESKGIPPLDLAEKIDDKIENRLDSLSKKFKEDLAKPAPKGQNKLITALQAGLGGAVGAIPSLLKGTATGIAKGLGGPLIGGLL